MQQIPNSITADQLQKLITSAQAEPQNLSPEETKVFVQELIIQTQEVLDRISGTPCPCPDTKRSTHYGQARRSLKSAIRNLKGVLKS